MKNVLVISTSRAEQGMIEAAQKAFGTYEFAFETTASFGQEAVWWDKQGPDILILCLPADDLMQGYYLTKLRADVPRKLPLLLLSPVISAGIMQLSQIFSKIRLMKTPVEGSYVIQTLRDLIAERENGKQQVHPRYSTDQDIFVSSEMKGLQVKANMKNLSFTGAYFETVSHEESFEPNEVIKISLQSGNPPREYAFAAKVVWTRPNLDSPGRGFGVNFVDRDEVYNHLLKGF